MSTDPHNYFSNNIAFISYPTTNLKVTTEFYQNFFGLQPLLETEDWVEFKVGNQRLAFNKADHPPKYIPQKGAIVWLETSSIEETVKALKIKGINIIQPIKSYPYGKMAQFEDPTANIFGLYQSTSKKNNPKV